MRHLLFAGVVGLGACGGSAGEPGPTGANGGSCSVVENPDGSATISCDDGSMATIGPGPVGATGPSGPAGMTGATGATGGIEEPSIVEGFFCEGETANAPPVSFLYSATVLSNGSLVATGHVYDLTRSKSSSALYAPGDVAYAIAPASVELEPDGWWTLSLDRATLIATVDYRATGDGPISDSWTMAPSACAHEFY